MTVTYDPSHPAYYDQADLRKEMVRAFEICHGCRICFNLCQSFPTLFDAVDRRDGDVASMTFDEQDRVIHECYQCKLCYLKCPYVPPHEWSLDFPRLVMRANAVEHRISKRTYHDRVVDQFFGRTDLVGRLSSAGAPVVNAIAGKRGSLARRAMQATIGIASERLLPPYSKERFTTWFRRRTPPLLVDPPGLQGKVSVFPTCFIEYMDPAIGKDLCKVYERNRVDCSVPQGTRCCGAPWLHQGDVEAFEKAARRNVESLVVELRAGKDVVVAQPTCAYVLKQDYPRYVRTHEADDVAAHTYDASEYLAALHTGEGTELETRFDGEVPDRVTYHLSCHLQAQSIGVKARELLRLAGIDVDLVSRCSGIDGTWGYRAQNYEMSLKVAQRMKSEIEEAANSTVCGDCHLANGSILQETGLKPVHPMQLLARAYGIPEER
ncbi:MAG: heterodisulfide reductase-related iron-sulfur binding cluster [Actinobacteria bacterium]|nr:heterodisulfide reductase-related iron-sulfur binding cluster [Actinomycetota bacterium]